MKLCDNCNKRKRRWYRAEHALTDIIPYYYSLLNWKDYSKCKDKNTGGDCPDYKSRLWIRITRQDVG